MKRMGGSFRGLAMIIVVGKGSTIHNTSAFESAKKIAEYLHQDGSFIYVGSSSGDIIRAITTDTAILEDAQKRSHLFLMLGHFTDYFCVYPDTFNIQYEVDIEE